jgi:hypothetical protein
MCVLKNDRDDMMGFRMYIMRAKGERGERNKMVKDGVKAVTELDMKC